MPDSKQRKLIVTGTAGAAIAIWIATGLYGLVKHLPTGVSFASREYLVSDVQFLYDLTYLRNDALVREQHIFDAVIKLIDEAEHVIVADMFLFNGLPSASRHHRDLASELTSALIEKKKNKPDIHISLITDEINTFYGAYSSPELEQLARHGINVIPADLTPLRDSNTAYSSLWRLFLRRFGTAGKGWIPNPFSASGPKVTLRSYLKLLNFKGNHRKVIVTERQAIVSSANPHNGSSSHSNIAFLVSGEIISDILAAEQAIAHFSGAYIPSVDSLQTSAGDIRVRYLTEGKIKNSLLHAIDSAVPEDRIDIGMFYLSDRTVIESLINASVRGVQVRLILDPNKDAFGRQKNGIPNRQTAWELIKNSRNRINIRWYMTHGEQYHSKMVIIRRPLTVTVFGGSANLTRRNIGDFNLEADVEITADIKAPFSVQVTDYFERIWSNRDGLYTSEFVTFREPSLSKYILYRFQEWSGLSTF